MTDERMMQVIIKLNNILNDLLRGGKRDPDVNALYDCLKEEAPKNKGIQLTFLLPLVEQEAINKLEQKDFKHIFKNDIAKCILIKVLSDFEDISDQHEIYVFATIALYRTAFKMKVNTLAHLMSIPLKDHIFTVDCDNEKIIKIISEAITEKIDNMIKSCPCDYSSTFTQITKYTDESIETIVSEIQSEYGVKVEYGLSLAGFFKTQESA